jgi:hypothetical protein
MRAHPIGTGPFKFVEFKPNQSIKVARNLDYWKPGLPYLDGVEWTIIPNRSSALLAFLAGKFDMTFPYEVTIPMLKDVHSQLPEAICEVTPLNVAPNLLVTRKPPFDSPDLRRAIAMTIDHKAFIDILGEGQGDIGEAAGLPEQAEAVRESGVSFPTIRGPLCEAAEYATANPLLVAVWDCAQRLVACADHQQTKSHAQLSVRTTELAVSVILCNDASARRLLLGQSPRMRLLEFLEEAIITIIEEAIDPPRLPPPFSDPWDIREAGERFRTAMAEGFPAARANRLEDGRSGRQDDPCVAAPAFPLT